MHTGHTGIKMTIDERICKLEQLLKEEFYINVPGTTISRVLMDTRLCEKEGVPVLTDRQGQLVWSVAVGGLQEVKLFFHGNSIDEALSEAEKNLAQRIKENKTRR